jgi:hypothetical protein
VIAAVDAKLTGLNPFTVPCGPTGHRYVPAAVAAGRFQINPPLPKNAK